MTERTLSELANAEIVPNAGGPNAWMLRFGEDDYDLVNKSAKNTLIVKDGVLSNGRELFEYGGIQVKVNLDDDEIHLHNGDTEVRVPEEKHENALWAVYDADGPRLQRLFDSLYTPTVREGLMDQFMPRFRQANEEIRKTDDGWLLNGDILVSWDGSNHPVNVAQTHVVSNGAAVAADEDKEAREISMPAGWTDTDEFDAVAPDGRTFTIDPVELKFLTTVGLILGRNPSHYEDDLTHTIGNANIVSFTDTKSGLHHNHGLQKHTLSDLSVSQDAIDRLWYNEYDHTGVWEMAIREEEFRNAPIDVFEDAENDNASKWEMIRSTREKAPIPKRVRSDLEERYGA